MTVDTADQARRKAAADDRAAQGLLEVLWAIKAHFDGETPIVGAR